MSPIEHVWDELLRRVPHHQMPPETLQELRDALVHAWNNIPHAFIQRLIGSMRRKCEAVVAARGRLDMINNIVSVFYGIQCSLSNVELSATIMTNASPDHNTFASKTVISFCPF
jgi:hypothetical protein